MSSDSQIHVARRERLLAAIGDGVAVVAAAPSSFRNSDVEHPYRQDSDFYYLTGFEEPEALLLLSNQQDERTALVVRPRSRDVELWDGPRLGPERAVTELGVHAAFALEELDTKLRQYLKDASQVYYSLGRQPQLDMRLLSALAKLRKSERAGVRAPRSIVELTDTLHESRLHKDEAELGTMRRAVAITEEAHRAAMHVAAPGKFEYEVATEIERVFASRGSQRPAYPSIVGSGPNATVLHYRGRRREMHDGELLLIDAGCELDYYASDVTRTFPVNGRFSGPQKAIYELVLAGQKAAIAVAQPGANLPDVHLAGAKVITAGLIELGLLDGTVEENLETDKYKKYFMHGTSHWLGMDVHDVGAYYPNAKPRELRAGMVFTIEPGVYIAPEADCDEKWHGIGVRIEDDIAITPNGSENLSAGIPKEVDDVEAACR